MTGPSGPLTLRKSDFTYLAQFKDFYVYLPGSPERGVYTFQATSGNAVGTATDFQYQLRTLPVPDKNTFAPVPGAVISAKTPIFRWDAVAYPDVPIFYRLEIWDPTFTNRVFATGWVQDMLYYTVPAGVLTPGQSYQWRVRVADGNDGSSIKIQNRSQSDYQPFTVSGTLAPHSAKPAIDLDGLGTCSYSVGASVATENWIRIIDHDGVASDGSSHVVTVRYPDNSTRRLNYSRGFSSTSVYYEFYESNRVPVSGDYVFTVTDPDGNPASRTEHLDYNPILPPAEDSIAPSVKNEFITATFDNVYVNGALYENFNSYGSIQELDFSKWRSNYSNVWISDGALVSGVSNSVGRGHASLDFNNPQSINSIQADINGCLRQ